ncbi:uncharacterized protein K02A2.6-like [Lineus longissimus]|uniref:uncharacterized protein K02A2.6-like n=1 Tax=Lineus longissimus TaxID=88925 RepID=UPI00315D3809
MQQEADETVDQFVARLRRQAQFCNFTNIDADIRDQVIDKCKSSKLRRKLLEKVDLTLKQAQDLARALEAVDYQMKSMDLGTSEKADSGASSSADSVNRVSHSSKRGSASGGKPKHDYRGPKGGQKGQKKGKCYRCGNEGHFGKDDCCPAKNVECRKCEKMGHFAKVCRTKQGHKKQYHVTESKRDSADEELYSIYSARDSSSEIQVDVGVSGKNVQFTVDTAASVSVIPHELYQEKFKDVLPLSPTNVKLKSYSGDEIPVMGEFKVEVCYNGQTASLPLYVTKGERVALFGRNWLSVIKLDWHRLFSVMSLTSDPEIQKVLDKYPHVFSNEMGTIRGYKADIRLKESCSPVFKKARPVPYALREKVGLELDRLEKAGVLEKCTTSEWASPIVVVSKSDGQIRICGDYKVTINPLIEDNAYPLPTSEDLFATLAGSEVFSKIDLSHAYQQLELTENSRELCTINTHQGLYRYRKLPFGIKSAPSIFQSVIDRILGNQKGVASILDDILIGTKIPEHVDSLDTVLKQLADHNVVAKRPKCKFKVPEVSYFGHMINAEGRACMKYKVDAILNARKPENVSELRTFLGIVGYYGSFIPNMSTKFAPLYRLLRNNTPWQWSHECDEALQSVKDELTSDRILVHYDPAKPLILATDASPTGVGALISHRMEDGSERPIAFASRSLTDSERNYAQIEKEGLGIIYGVKKFHKYLYGRKFELITDHEPLTTIFGPKTGVPTLAALRLQRWALILMAYDYTIHYRRSKDHANSDMLSRFPVDDCQTATELKINYFSMVDELPVSAEDISEQTRKDPILSRVYHYVMHGWPDQGKDPDIVEYWKRRDELSADQGCLLWGIRVVIPPKFRSRLLKELHHEHFGMVRMKAMARSYLWYPGIDVDIEALVKSCDACLAFQSNPGPVPLIPWPYPTKFWERVHIDFGYLEQLNYLLLVDAHSKWVEIELMYQNTTAEKTVDVLRSWFARFGLPIECVSDNGPQFISQVFEDFCSRNGIKHTLSPPYHPQTNGAAENIVKEAKKAFKKHYYAERKGSEPKLSAKQRVDDFLLTYRSTPHCTTGQSPADLVLKRGLRTRFSILRPDLNKSVTQKQQKMVDIHDQRGVKMRTFSQNEVVRVKNTRGGGNVKWLPGKVVKVLGPQSYVVRVGSRNRYVHVDHLQKSGETEPARLESEGPPAAPIVEVVSPDPVDTPTPGSSVGSALAPVSNPNVLNERSEVGGTSPRYPRRANRKGPDRLIESHG